MIANLRGVPGSGKSYVGHALARHAIKRLMLPLGHELNDGKKAAILGYLLPGDLCVLGTYERVSGGMEGGTATIQREIVRRAAEKYAHVFFEGYFISITSGPWIKMVPLLSQPLTLLALDTPLEVCKERILIRNGGKEINHDIHTGHFNNFHKNVIPKMIEAGIDVRWIDHTRAVEETCEHLYAAGWTGASV